MNPFIMSVVEGIGFGIGWGLICAGGKLWEKAIIVGRVWLTARSLKPAGQRPSTGLWTPTQNVTPRNYQYKTPINRSASLTAVANRRARLDNLNASVEQDTE